MVDSISSVNQQDPAENKPPISGTDKPRPSMAETKEQYKGVKASSMDELAKKAPEAMDVINRSIALKICQQMKKRADEGRKRIKEMNR